MTSILLSEVAQLCLVAVDLLKVTPIASNYYSFVYYFVAVFHQQAIVFSCREIGIIATRDIVVLDKHRICLKRLQRDIAFCADVP